MNPIRPDDLVTAQEWRYAVKKFDPVRKIPDDTWAALEKSLLLTPSSYGLQPWKFLIVTEPTIRQELRKASWNQSQVTDSSHYVVFTRRKSVDEAYIDHFLLSVAQHRGIPVAALAGYKKVIVGDVVNGERGKYVREWAARQVYIALGNFMTSCALLGVDACPMEGLDPQKYDDILNLSGTMYETVVSCAAGYRSLDDNFASMKKVRFPATDMLERFT